MRLGRRLAWCSGIVGLTACVPSLPLTGGEIIGCSEAGDCPAGWTCGTEGVCVNDAGDHEGPRLVSVTPISAVDIQVIFSEPVADAGAAALDSYVIAAADPSLGLPCTPTFKVATVVHDATTPQRVDLIVEGQGPGRAYRLTVTGITDIVGNALQSGEGKDTQAFDGFGTLDDSAPEVVSPALDAAESSARPVVFEWTPRPGVSCYRIEIAAAVPDGSGGYTAPNFSTTLVDQEIDDNHFEAVLPGLGAAPVTLYWRVRSDVSDFTLSHFEPVGTELHVYCPGDAASCDTGGPEAGNTTAPLRSIRRAIDAAVAFDLHTVRVANRGDDGGGQPAAYFDNVYAEPGVDLLGGYTTDFSDLHRYDDGRTLLTSDSVTVTVANVTAQNGTLELSGFEIGTESPDGAAPLQIVASDESATVKDCTIHGGPMDPACGVARPDLQCISSRNAVVMSVGRGPGAQLVDSIVDSGDWPAVAGILIANGSGRVVSTEVHIGGVSPSSILPGFAYGVQAQNAHDVVLDGVTITNRGIRAYTVAVLFDTTLGPVVHDSHVFLESTDSVTGIQSHNSPLLRIDSSWILLHGIAPGSSTRGIDLPEYLPYLSAGDQVTNNVVWATTPVQPGGQGAVVTVAHNTFIAEVDPGDISVALAWIYLRGAVTNDLLIASAGTNRWGLMGTPPSFEHNAMAGITAADASQGFVMGTADPDDPNGLDTAAYDPALCMPTVTAATCAPAAPTSTIQAGGNLDAGPNWQALFQSPPVGLVFDGNLDPDIAATLAQNDFRPISSSPIVHAGKSTMVDDCGVAEFPIPCGNVTEDAAGQPRGDCATPSTCPTIGAYEPAP